MEKRNFLILILTLLAFLSFFIINKNRSFTRNYLNVVSSTKNPTSNESKCFSDKDCSTGYFCDYNTPGGLNSDDRHVSGKPYGSQRCIKKCQNNDECSNKKCLEFNIVIEDTVRAYKGCLLE